MNTNMFQEEILWIESMCDKLLGLGTNLISLADQVCQISDIAAKSLISIESKRSSLISLGTLNEGYENILKENASNQSNIVKKCQDLINQINAHMNFQKKLFHLLKGKPFFMTTKEEEVSSFQINKMEDFNAINLLFTKNCNEISELEAATHLFLKNTLSQQIILDETLEMLDKEKPSSLFKKNISLFSSRISLFSIPLCLWEINTVSDNVGSNNNKPESLEQGTSIKPGD